MRLTSKASFENLSLRLICQNVSFFKTQDMEHKFVPQTIHGLTSCS